MTFKIISDPIICTKSIPIINDEAHEHVIRMRVVNRPPAHLVVPVRASLIVVAIITLAMLLVTGIILAVATTPFPRTTTTTRYQGFCTIPIKDVPDELGWYEQPSYKVMPLRWTAATNADAQILTADDDSDDVITGLKEHFDIGDRIEKISVVDNGRHVNFIHDFEENVTGIVDTERCFAMELDRSAVLPPALLVFSIEGGAPFDVSRVRATLRAALPPAGPPPAGPPPAGPPPAGPPPAALADLCQGKPLYRLHQDDSKVVKRSVDGPSHDYIQFAGRRVQEFDIVNLADLLQHEQDLAALTAT